MTSHFASIGRYSLAAAAFCLFAAPASVAAAEAKTGVLLMHDGRLVAGRIERLGDRFRVQQDGVEIQIKVAEVALAAASARECYLWKLTTIDPGAGEGHLQVALWCLQHQLIAEAGEELAAARAVEPLHPKITLVERRLRQATAVPAVRAPRPSQVEQKQALHEAPAGAESAGKSAALPSRLRADDLDRFVRTLPEGAVGQFTTRVQPVLMNHCALAGCHGPGSQSNFVLDRVSDRRTANRRSTQRNLYAALQQVDVQSPAESKLLTLPLRAHGTAKGPIFSGRQSLQYEQLLFWAQRASGAPVAFAVQQANAIDEPAPSMVTQLPPPMSRSDRPRSDREERAKAARASRAARELELAKNKKTPGERPSHASEESPFDSAARGTPAGSIKPDAPQAASGDPFDPEVFNRRIGKTSPAADADE